MPELHEHLFKIVLVGNSGVGKTCLVRQFTEQKSPSDSESLGQSITIGVDFFIKSVSLPRGASVKLQLWDTAGQERFRSITQSYYRSAHCLILVYDIASQASFDALPRWLKDVDRVFERSGNTGANSNAANSNSSSSSSSSSPVLRVLVGNKCDKDDENGREVPASIAQKFASINKFDLFTETSAFEHGSVTQLFEDIAELLVESQAAHESSASCSGAFSLTPDRGPSSSTAAAPTQALRDTIAALRTKGICSQC